MLGQHSATELHPGPKYAAVKMMALSVLAHGSQPPSCVGLDFWGVGWDCECRTEAGPQCSMVEAVQCGGQPGTWPLALFGFLSLNLKSEETPMMRSRGPEVSLLDPH